jgi:hypothetical protein
MSRQDAQLNDVRKGELIQCNTELVDKAIQIITSAIANSIAWPEIGTWLRWNQCYALAL